MRGDGWHQQGSGSEDGTVSLLIVLLQGTRYAVRLVSVERVHRMAACTPLPGAPPCIHGVLGIRGATVPVADPRRRLGLPTRDPLPEDRLVLVRTPVRRIALWVDDVEGVVETAAESIVPAGPSLPAGAPVEGLVRLGDDLVLIQDVERFLSGDEERILDESLVRHTGSVP